MSGWRRELFIELNECQSCIQIHQRENMGSCMDIQLMNCLAVVVLREG